MISTPQRRFRARITLAALLSLGMSVVTPRVQAATPDEVDAALETAKAYLYSRQKDGTWETTLTVPTKDEANAKGASSSISIGQWGGLTSLAVYALLAAGESPQDPKLIPAIKFLETADIKGVYAIGIRSQLYTFLPPSKDVKKLAASDVDKYEDAISKKPSSKGMFEYQLSPKSFSRIDHSVSQYGVLGAWACERAGAEVPTGFWQSVEDGWIRDQNKDGSWVYSNDTFNPASKLPRASMVVAGIATLFITQDYVHATNGIYCTGNVVNPHIELGLKWIGDNFEQVFTDASGNHAPYYALYGVERVGVASGRKYLGAINWYDRGADYLVKSQNKKTGEWNAKYSVERLEDTCLAMLFLSRGRAPVVFNKLQYDVAGKEGNWNERPRDIANLTRWIGKQTEKDLNWQITTMKGPATELMDAPVLYISGNKPLQFTAEEEAKLRTFCEEGGLILGHADCGNTSFAESFRKLGNKLFPAYDFRELPASSPIYTNEQYPRSSWKAPPIVLAMSNGVRELMILEPSNDPGRHWQLEETGRYQADYELADDIFLYAIDKKNLQEKGKTFVVEPLPAVQTNRTIKLARLQYNGNWDPEPGGWRRLAAILHNNSQIDLQVSTVKLGTGQLGDGKTGPKVASITGTGILKLDTASRQEIKNFVEGGGTLIVDAAGGSGDFAVSSASELQTIFGASETGELKTALPAASEVFNMPGGQITDFRYRSFAKNNVGSMHGPLLAAISFNKRLGVFYSKLDLSTGIVGSLTDGIIGYEPATATAIMTNLVIYGGLGQKAVVTTPPKPAAKPASAAN